MVVNSQFLGVCKNCSSPVYVEYNGKDFQVKRTCDCAEFYCISTQKIEDLLIMKEKIVNSSV